MAESATQQGGQIPIRVKGQRTCIYHHGKSLQFFCENCHDIACTECTSSTHNGHEFLTLSNVSARKKKKLQKSISKKETNHIPSIRKSIKSIDAEIKETDATFESLAVDVKKQRDKLKRKIDLLADKTLAVYEKLKVENVTLLKNYKAEHENQLAVLRSQVEDCKTLIRTGDDITVCDSDAHIESPAALPVKPILNTASFSANLMPLDNLKHAFGTVKKDKNPSDVKSIDKSGNEVPKDKTEVSEHQTGKLPKEVKYQTPAQQRQQNNPVRPPVEMEFIIPAPVTVMAKMRNGDIWMNDTHRKTMLTGILQNIEHRRQITDFCFSSENQELWICSIDDNSVIEVTSAPSTPKFYTDESPLCICATMDGHLIVGMSKQITKYNSQGGVIITTKPTLFSLFSKPIVCSPRQIVECPATKNIAVADRSSMEVLVMDKYFNELFRYPNQTQIKFSDMSIERFIPNNIFFTPDGCIIIEDIGNSTVHHTSGKGELYGYFHH